MKKSLLAFALLACASLACVAYSAVERAVGYAVSAYTRVKAWVLDGFALAATKSDARTPVPVPLVQAKAFVLRLAKRERPVLTSSWRMCPST